MPPRCGPESPSWRPGSRPPPRRWCRRGCRCPRRSVQPRRRASSPRSRGRNFIRGYRKSWGVVAMVERDLRALFEKSAGEAPIFPPESCLRREWGDAPGGRMPPWFVSAPGFGDVPQVEVSATFSESPGVAVAGPGVPAPGLGRATRCGASGRAGSGLWCSVLRRAWRRCRRFVRGSSTLVPRGWS